MPLASTVLATMAMCCGHTAATPPLLTASVDPRERGRAVPRHFVGFSYEFPTVQHDTIGNTFTGINEPLARLYDHITETGLGAPEMRLGGGAADASRWDPDNTQRPPGIEYNITPYFLEQIANFQKRTRSPLVVGLNMAAGQPKLTLDMARAVRQIIGARNIDALEVGNEPDVYPRRPYGEGRTARPKRWKFSDYLRELPRFVDPVRKLGLPISAPNAATWEPEIKPFLRRERRRVNLLSYHHYALTDCPGDPTGDYPNSIAGLLSRKVQRNGVNKFNFLAQQARKAHRPIRLSETNSSDCGWKQNGISDRMASALWSADWLFALANVGLDGVNFHVSGAMAPMFARYDVNLKHHVIAVQPLYYGILLFSRAVGNRGRVLIGTTFKSKVRGNRNVIAWAVRARNGTVRIVVINKEPRLGGRVLLRVPGGARTGTLERLSAPSLSATRTEVRLAGQSWGDTTMTGDPEGTPVRERVRRRGRSYSFQLPAGSAAMLTVRR